MTWPLPSNGLSEVGQLSGLVNHTREPVDECQGNIGQPMWVKAEGSQGWSAENRHRYPVSCRAMKRCDSSIFLISSSLGL